MQLCASNIHAWVKKKNGPKDANCYLSLRALILSSSNLKMSNTVISHSNVASTPANLILHLLVHIRLAWIRKTAVCRSGSMLWLHLVATCTYCKTHSGTWTCSMGTICASSSRLWTYWILFKNFTLQRNNNIQHSSCRDSWNCKCTCHAFKIIL